MHGEAKSFRGSYIQVHGAFQSLDSPLVLLACGSCPWIQQISVQINYDYDPEPGHGDLSDALDSFLSHQHTIQTEY